MNNTKDLMPEIDTPSQAAPAPHKRRVRYSGKYPKKFSEKYIGIFIMFYELFVQNQPKRMQINITFL